MGVPILGTARPSQLRVGSAVGLFGHQLDHLGNHLCHLGRVMISIHRAPSVDPNCECPDGKWKSSPAPIVSLLSSA